MIADVPPFYVKFVRSLLERRRMARLQTAMPQTVEAVSGKLVPKPDMKRLPEPATALKALPVPERAVQDVLSLPDRDCLRRVVPDFDHLEYGD